MMKTKTRMEKEKSVISIETVDLEDDLNFFTHIFYRGTTKADPIPVERYAEDKDLQRAIMESYLKSTTGKIIDLTAAIGNDDEEDVQILKSIPYSVRVFGQSSNSKSCSFFTCEICLESKPNKQLHRINDCDHGFCSDCVSRYVDSKLQNNSVQIRCPVSGCAVGFLDLGQCRAILPRRVSDRWGDALCEAAIPNSHKFYCPYKDCSALFIDDGGFGEVMSPFQCMNCVRSFCVDCKVPWHSGFSCEEFNGLDKDEREVEDLMLMNLADGQRWRRCPNCRYYVEKSYGCLHMTCRCGVKFCYACGQLKCSCTPTH